MEDGAVPGPVVATADGWVRGRTIWRARNTTPVDVFKGIPYAAAPVGRLRWCPPQPAPRWPGVRNAFEFGPDLPQARNPRLRAPCTSEDCLYLNVWSPAGAAPGSLPVMVWIHGGGFVGGSGSDVRSDGAAMAGQGAVVVSFNYRAGLFGFLAHPALSQESPHGVSGNYGLLDQLAALDWVKNNIAAFGGDAARVTVFGVSAGSASISLLLTSELARGRFQQAILHSPGACRPLASLADAERAGSVLGADIAALRQLSAEDLLAKTSLLSPQVRGLTTPRVLRPIRDGWVIAEDERPAFKAGRLHRMPIIVGSNADEGSLLTKGWPVETLKPYRELVQSNFGPAAREAAALYPANADSEVRSRVAEMFADTQFNFGTRLLAQAMARFEPRTWRYLFLRRRPGQTDGPHHGEEVAHVFGNLEAAAPGETARFDATDEEVSAAMMKTWVTFAVAGDPNGPGLPHWPAYEARNDNYLAFDDRVAARQGWRAEQLDFLDGFFDTTGPTPGN